MGKDLRGSWPLRSRREGIIHADQSFCGLILGFRGWSLGSVGR